MLIRLIKVICRDILYRFTVNFVQELLEVDLPNPMEDDLPVDNRGQQGLPTVHDLPPANIDDIAHNTESPNISKNSSKDLEHVFPWILIFIISLSRLLR